MRLWVRAMSGDASGRVAPCAVCGVDSTRLSADLAGARWGAIAFMGEVATALGIDAQNDGWRVVEHARSLRAAADGVVVAMRAHGAATNDGTHEEEMRAAADAANALVVLEAVLGKV